MVFQTLLNCPMCDEKKPAAKPVPNSDSYVSMYYTSAPAAAAPTQQLAAGNPASHLVYGENATRALGQKAAINPYPRSY
jgi:hypothetical protein